MSVSRMPTSRVLNAAFQERGIEGVVKWEVIDIAPNRRVRIRFEATNSEWRQGVWLKTDKGLVANGQQFTSVELWSDTAPAKVEIECHTSDGLLHLYNIWDRGRGRESQAYTSGMLVEEAGSGRRYRCNDIGFETKFDKLIFSVEVH